MIGLNQVHSNLNGENDDSYNENYDNLSGFIMAQYYYGTSIDLKGISTRRQYSIVEGYDTEEVIEYCTDYLQGVTSIGIVTSQHEVLLQHMAILGPYINEHNRMLKYRTQQNILTMVKRQRVIFNILWQRTKDTKLVGIHLSQSIDEKKLSGHTLNARSRIDKESYYGVIQEYIWELKCNSIITSMLKCKMVDNQRGVKVDNDDFTIVDFSTNGYVSKPFILVKRTSCYCRIHDQSLNLQSEYEDEEEEEMQVKESANGKGSVLKSAFSEFDFRDQYMNKHDVGDSSVMSKYNS
ncbi:hypothetical protein LXL04_038803 [Taraxacum kok-saghyz]